MADTGRLALLGASARPMRIRYAVASWDGSLSVFGHTDTSGLSSVTVDYGQTYPATVFETDLPRKIRYLIDSSAAATAATYEYSPFGRTIVAHNPLADANPVRFSTKVAGGTELPGVPAGPELYYYGYRYYSHKLGRWLNRDPIGEAAGPNSYTFCLGQPNTNVDILGLLIPDARHAARSALYSVLTLFRGSATGSAAGIGSLVGNLYTALGRVSNVVYYRYDGPTRAVYSPDDNSMRVRPLRPEALAEDVVHESVHALNTLVGGVSDWNISRDEGMAYATIAMFKSLKLFLLLESKLKDFDLNSTEGGGSTCRSLRASANLWWGLGWRKLWYTNSAWKTEVKYRPIHRFGRGERITRAADSTDFANVERHLGLDLKCSTLAKAFNKLVPQCCRDQIHFTCTKTSSSPGDIPTTMDMPDTFR